ncbi:MAG: TetR/AcrR family transcriptional regulator [Candidatus Coatesbacteria bacterium]|nr:MAG: TetR/AcrR family transcriptional regulator [Candidatus Coatesbacteria bacterium]
MPRNTHPNPARDRILKAARGLFASRAYDGVSIGELAAAAQVNRAMLYYYFRDKQDLYRQSIISVLDLIPALWEREDLKRGAPAERLDRYVVALWEALAENREAMPMIMRELASGGSERELIFKRYLVPNALFVGKLIEEGVQAGDFSAAPPLFATIALISGIIMPNFGLAVGTPFVTEISGSITEGREYLDFYRDYLRRALSVPEGKGGDRGGLE